MEHKKELDWSQKPVGEAERDYLWWETEEEYTAEDSLWQLFYNNGGGPGDGVGILSFQFEGVMYRIYTMGPACAFHPAPDDPETDLLESHDWSTWGELLETIRWNNGKTLSEMMRTVSYEALSFDRDTPLRYTPKKRQPDPDSLNPESPIPEADCLPRSAPFGIHWL